MDFVIFTSFSFAVYNMNAPAVGIIVFNNYNDFLQAIMLADALEFCYTVTDIFSFPTVIVYNSSDYNLLVTWVITPPTAGYVQHVMF